MCHCICRTHHWCAAHSCMFCCHKKPGPCSLLGLPQIRRVGQAAPAECSSLNWHPNVGSPLLAPFTKLCQLSQGGLCAPPWASCGDRCRVWRGLLFSCGVLGFQSSTSSIKPGARTVQGRDRGTPLREHSAPSGLEHNLLATETGCQPDQAHSAASQRATVLMSLPSRSTVRKGAGLQGVTLTSSSFAPPVIIKRQTPSCIYGLGPGLYAQQVPPHPHHPTPHTHRLRFPFFL
jgi:hypothetical protein